MGRKELLFGLGVVAAACVACTAILGDFNPTAGTGPGAGAGGGTDTAPPNDAPTDAPGLTGFLATKVAAGAHHTCGVRAGRVYCWGRNTDGQLGLDPATYPVSEKPRQIAGLGEGDPKTLAIIAVATGSAHSCALDISGNVWCWGKNDLGQLGVPGPAAGSFIPKKVQKSGAGMPVLANIAAISAAASTSCAVDGSGGVSCWGANAQGQAGSAVAASVTVATDVGNTLNAATSANSEQHTCSAGTGTGTSDKVYCWGTQTAGELGNDGGVALVPSPTAPPLVLASAANSVATGIAHSCASVASGGGSAECWGDNTFGQIGVAGAGPFNSPTPVATLTGVNVVRASGNYSCAIKTDKNVVCWGANEHGQLGRGGSAKATTNTDVQPVMGLAGVTDLGLGLDHMCAVVARAGAAATDPGQVMCWGNGADHQLGIPSTDDQTAPQLVTTD